MALLAIYEVPHPILKQKALPVEVVDDDIRRLISDMAETMYAAPGVGLAAPQVGVSRRLLVADVPVGSDGVAEIPDGQNPERGRALLALINPEIVARSGEASYEEGCLSVPDMWEPIKRSHEVVVKALDEQGRAITVTARGYYSVVLQHEMDHLDGITILDRVGRLKRSMYQARKARKRKEGPETRAGA